MTVPISDRLSQLYVGNGTNTRFDFNFRVFNQEDATGIAIRKRAKLNLKRLTHPHIQLLLIKTASAVMLFLTPHQLHLYILYSWCNSP